MEKMGVVGTDNDPSHSIPFLYPRKESRDNDYSDDDRRDSENTSRDMTDPSIYSLADYRGLQARVSILTYTSIATSFFAIGCLLILLLLSIDNNSREKDVVSVLLSCMFEFLLNIEVIHQGDGS